jgi:hypothetical protein
MKKVKTHGRGDAGIEVAATADKDFDRPVWTYFIEKLSYVDRKAASLD